MNISTNEDRCGLQHHFKLWYRFMHYHTAIPSTIHLLAISTGVFRLWHRYKTKQYYWDDLCAACTLLFGVMLFLSMWLWPIYEVPGNSLEPEERVVRIWIMAALVPCVNWSSRIGVALSIYRIAEADTLRKRCITILVCVFLLVWTTNIVLKLINCSGEEKLRLNRVNPSCMDRREQLCFTGLFIACDACLVCIPLHMLRHLRLPKNDRFLVRAVFSASVLSAMADIVTTVCNIAYFPAHVKDMFVVEMTVQIRGAVSLIVCNLIVVMPCIYRLFKRTEQDLSIPISIHIDTSPARMSIDDRPMPSISQVEQAIVRDECSRGCVLAQLATRVSERWPHNPGEHLFAPRCANKRGSGTVISRSGDGRIP